MKISHAVVWLCLSCAVIAECVHLEPTLDGHETTDQTIGWCDGGSLTWKIPFGWNKEPHTQDADPVGRFAEGVRQIFRISAGGDFRMEKLGHNAERKLDGRIFVDGREDDGILDNN